MLITNLHVDKESILYMKRNASTHLKMRSRIQKNTGTVADEVKSSVPGWFFSFGSIQPQTNQDP